LFSKILIANRGEIAMRVIRACRMLGVRSVAIHSEADAGALHVRFADEAVCVGPADPQKSYLNIPQIIAAAEITGADAVHPGYGFLSENAGFAEVCHRCRLAFIGPTPESMRAWGDKVSARANAKRFGLPLLPGTGVLRDGAHAAEEAAVIGYPVILKASGGGGGRGMRVVREEAEIARAFETASHEAMVGFKNPDVYLERFVEEPRHIEFQVLADQHGGVWTLGERECSLQRRHQKVMEEGPSPALNAPERGAIGDVVAKAMRELKYLGVGTVEFLYEQGRFYFIEMNTRIQVEHPVTEMITDIDLVLEQIRIANGDAMTLGQADVKFNGHAIECRINAENPVSFAPSPGRIVHYHPPGGVGVRIDSAAYQGYAIPPYYDSLIGKLIVHGKTRGECLMRLRRALDEFVVDGVETTLPLFRALVREPDIVDGDYHIHWLERFLAKGATGS
jgi:acetyl-CoA carboxylase biotin carboxylase subunit